MPEDIAALEHLFSRLADTPGFARREVQVTMAAAVREALESEGRLFIEAPTGVGKSLAYLVPLGAWATGAPDRRAVVATNTKALQRQLVEQDLRVLERLLDHPVRYALAMGGENYVCLRRLGQVRQMKLFDAVDAGSLGALHAWAVSTRTGLRSEIGVPEPVWAEVCRIGDLCFGRDCRFRSGCPFLRARANEARAQILVVNHHLLLSNWAAGSGAIPEFQALVIDEAHRFEDAARSVLTGEISPRRIHYALNGLLATDGKRGLFRRITGGDSPLYRSLEERVRGLRSAFGDWFAALAALYPPPAPAALTPSSTIPPPPEEALRALADAIETVVPREEEAERERDAGVARCRGIAEELRAAVSFERPGIVHWLEHESSGPRLMASPLEVGPTLADGFFPSVGGLVLTSATLSTAGDFSFTRNRLGLADAGELLLGSPFDYERQALLYLPGDMPDPRDDDFARQVALRLSDLGRASHGGVLALFTSYATMRLVRSLLDVPGTEILMQGEADPYSLIEEFRLHPNAMLLGTHTFWQGVDIPGDDLRCVVITRLPFAVPDSPLLAARFEEIRDRGRNPFFEEQVPQAVLLFKQGFGRLIRRGDDRGVVAVLDPRIRSKSYGRHFLASLPAMRTTDSFEDVKEFFESNPGR